jgi:Heterokaryon incompatibility protein (HET)
MEDSSPEQFAYSKLNTDLNSDFTIRLLTIQPRLNDDIIRCGISIVSLANAPPYTALSYRWGSLSSRRFDIDLDGRRFSVLENLWNFLWHQSSKSESSTIWTDYICIDQTSISERNHQVQMMGQIYQKAINVRIWLGEDEDESLSAMKFISSLDAICTNNAPFVISELRRQLQRTHSTYSTVVTTDPIRQIICSYRSLFGALNPSRFLKALTPLCLREYWSRTWIIQEVCLAQDIIVCCGALEVPWAVFTFVGYNRDFNVLYRLLDISDGYDGRLTSKTWLGLSNEQKQIAQSLFVRLCKQKTRHLRTLQENLESFHDSSSAEMKDKVYSLLAISTDCAAGEGIRVEYEKSPGQFFFDVLKFISPKNLMSFASMLKSSLGVCYSDMNKVQGKAEECLLLAPLTVVGRIGETRTASVIGFEYRITVFLAKFDPERGVVDVESTKPGTYRCPEHLGKPGRLIYQIADSTVFLLCDGRAETLRPLCRLCFFVEGSIHGRSFMDIARSSSIRSKTCLRQEWRPSEIIWDKTHQSHQITLNKDEINSILDPSRAPLWERQRTGPWEQEYRSGRLYRVLEIEGKASITFILGVLTLKVFEGDKYVQWDNEKGPLKRGGPPMQPMQPMQPHS